MVTVIAGERKNAYKRGATWNDSFFYDGGYNTESAVEALENLDPDSLTPRQALEWIYRLKSLV